MAPARARWANALGIAAVGLCVALVLPLVLGCTSASYVLQAGCGQLDISLGARSIDDVIADRGTPKRVASLLGEVASMKRFGEKNGLKPTNNYTKYVNLDRAAAVWVVTASEPLRFRLSTWTFPVVGSVSYLGWFDRREADLFALDLAYDGLDVDVRGAGAYSTLGWFEDPVLSTMIPPGDEALGQLAETVLHESTHATIYVAGQTVFNESVASFVGDALAEAYLDERMGPASPQKIAYVSGQRASEQRRDVLHAAYVELARVYDSSASDAEKLAQKRRILGELRAALGLKRPITNATLAQFKAYNSSKADMRALLDACGGSFKRLVAALKRVPASSFAGPQDTDIARVIAPLLRACGDG